jgi:hypothetical protein
VLGWREWLSLPELGVKRIKAKVDTGARTSAIHAFDVDTYERDGDRRVRFTIHPIQRNDERIVEADAAVHDVREVRSSSGVATERIVIVTPIRLLGETWPIELTLANRDAMGFRMLLGREAIRGRMLVDPGTSYAGGRPSPPSKHASPTE